VPGLGARTFAVSFGRQPQPHWKLKGAGELEVQDDQVVIRGRARKQFRSVPTTITLPLTNIINVIREGSLVQCHVRDSGTGRVLRIWSVNEQDAERLAQALPAERTPEFEKLVAEHKSFYSALDNLGTRPAVTQVLVILNCLVFAYTVFAGAGLMAVNAPLLVKFGTNFGPLTLNGQWWRLFTSLFLHFGLFHLALNMWALWNVGQLAERLYGSPYFLVLYIFAGLCGSLLSLYWHPNLNSAGASGAIFGVLGALFAFMVNPKTRIPASIAAAERNSALIFIFYNLINGFALANIDNAAHIGGLLGGMAMGWLLARPVDVEARQNPVPRLALATFLGLVLILALSWPLFHRGR
jgi:rhomboid protease GluP